MFKSDWIRYSFFVLAAAFLAFCLGMTMALFQLPPYGLFASTRATLKEMIVGPWLRDPKIVPRKYPGDGVTVNVEGRTAPGLTLVQGVFGEGPAIRLYDMAGTLIREWPMDFDAAWPNPTHVVPRKNLPKSRFGYHTQGVVIEPDGSIVVNYAEKGTAKYGACGELIWTLDRMTHHSITRTADGNYWIPAKLEPDQIDPSDFILGANARKVMDSDNFYADVALLVSPEGKILREVPVLGPALDWLGAEQEFVVFEKMDPAALDPLHLNDIEVVTPALAAKIPDVDPGDLLFSLRNPSALAIADAETGAFKWMTSGPWMAQHDPDIAADGRIEVYDNGILRALPGRDFAGTRILSHDPATGRTETLYPKNKEAVFFSWIMGTHQELPNGNRLVAETAAGRVFETTPEGEIVWSLVLPSSADTAALIESAYRIPEGAIPAGTWACDKVEK